MHTKKINLDPIELFSRLKNEKNPIFLYSTTKNGFKKQIAFNPTEILSLKRSEKAIEKLRKFQQKHTKKGNLLVGFISYDLGYTLLNTTPKSKNDLNLPDIYFLAFENWMEFTATKAKLFYKSTSYPDKIGQIVSRPKEKEEKPNSENFKPEMSRSKYNSAYKKIQKHIREGDIYQINLTHRLKARTTTPAKKLFLETIKKNPVDFLAFVDGSTFQVLSASPERFIKTKGKKITTSPIKGTRPRGRTAKIDQKNKKELLQSKKEEAELNMITDLLRNDLGKIAKSGSVKVTEHRIVTKLPKVWHTHSTIQAELANKTSPLDALISMHPGGSITGCPKKRAFEIIDNLEPTTRSIYTGKIGYIEPSGDLEFSIAIRTIIKKNDKLYLQVGGGIVVDSQNQDEFEETLHKAASFMKILK